MPVIREAKLFEAGNYPDKGIECDGSHLDAIISSFAPGVPVRVQHGPSAFDGKLGHVVSVWRKGVELWGNIEFPDTVWSFLESMGTKKLSVGLDRLCKKLIEVSIVDIPRVLTAQVFSDIVSETMVCFDNNFELEEKYMPEYSPEVLTAIKAAEDRGKVAGIAEAGAQVDNQAKVFAAENARLVREKAESEADMYLISLKAEGKMPPACEKFARALLVDGGGNVVFADGGKMTVADSFKQFMTNLPVVVAMSGTSVANTDVKTLSAAGVAVYESLGFSAEEIKELEGGA